MHAWLTNPPVPDRSFIYLNESFSLRVRIGKPICAANLFILSYILGKFLHSEERLGDHMIDMTTSFCVWNHQHVPEDGGDITVNNTKLKPLAT